MSSELDATCLSFLAHWMSLRSNARITTLEAFLDHPSPRHAPLVFMLEIGERVIVRLQGTGLVERWGGEITGATFFEGQDPGYVRQFLENFQAVLEHPCGYYSVNQYASGRERNLRSQVLYLPLAVRAGRPRRIVGYTVERPHALQGEPLLTKRTTLRAGWIDLGAGMPNQAPHQPTGERTAVTPP